MADDTVIKMWQEFLHTLYPPISDYVAPNREAALKELFYAGGIAMLDKILLLGCHAPDEPTMFRELMALREELIEYQNSVKRRKA